MNITINKLGLLPADRIVIPKSGLQIVQHHAIYLGQNYYGKHLIVENKIGSGVKITEAEDFFKNVNTVTKIEKFQGSNYERRLTIQKALKKLGQPYNLINYNCQHFANDVLNNKIESEQVRNAFVGMVAFFFLIIFFTQTKQ